MPVSIPSLSYPANTQNVNPALVFSKYRLALGKVRAGTANARILCVGDSTFAGTGDSTTATIPATKSCPTRLAQILNTTVTPSAVGLGIPPSILNGQADQRWTLGTGWATESNFGAGAAASYLGTASTGNLVYTPSPQVTCDGFYVYYLGNSTLGTLTCTASGGSSTPILCSSLSAGVYRTLISAGSASATNSLTIVGTVANNHVVGVEPVLSTKSQVLVGNAGVGSTLSGSWASSGTANFNAVPFIKTVAPDLTIISLGINDAANSASVATFSNNMQTIITAAKISGDVLLCDMPPSSSGIGGGGPALEATYLSVYANLAAVNNCAYLSMWGRFGGAWQTSYMSDQAHCNDQGNFDWAQFIANVIAAP